MFAALDAFRAELDSRGAGTTVPEGGSGAGFDMGQGEEKEVRFRSESGTVFVYTSEYNGPIAVHNSVPIVFGRQTHRWSGAVGKRGKTSRSGKPCARGYQCLTPDVYS